MFVNPLWSEVVEDSVEKCFAVSRVDFKIIQRQPSVNYKPSRAQPIELQLKPIPAE